MVFLLRTLWMRRVILHYNSDGDLYTLPSSTPAATTHALIAASSSLWHQRLRHLAPSILARLNKQHLIPCNKVARSICHSCQLGKDTRLPFSLSSSHTAAPFELLHCDVWTSPVTSISGFSYYLVILDDYTHFCWTFPIRHKSDAHQHLVNFVAYASTQFGLVVKSFQADNGTEFVNNAIATYLASHGIHLCLSCPCTSPQNSKAKRVMRTLNNSICTLLLHASISPSYWVKPGPPHAIYLTRAPPPPLTMKYLSLGSTASHQSTIIFECLGCLCYPNLQATSAHKLAARSTTCVFLGYPSSHKGYRCLDLSSHRIIIS
jgi:hypothetical protein